MPANKNQHYVPKLHLRAFSNNNDQKSIGVWNIDRDLYVPSGSITSQASSDYFYGKDLELETVLGKHETQISQIILDIIKSKKLFKALSEDHIDFLTFVF